MDLSIVIISYNVREKLEQNLKSIFNSSGNINFEVIVVDNNSSDYSAEMVIKSFPQVRLIRNQKNIGFSRANNLAISIAQGDFILLLNPDMRLFPDTLKNSLDFAKNNPQAIVSSCLLVDNKNQIIKHVRRFPAFWDQLAIILKLAHIFPGILKSYLYFNFDYNNSQKVPSVRGSFFMINKKEYQKISKKESPFLDERYFLWFEEVDFCREMYNIGGEVWYNSQAICLDYVGQSFSLLKRAKAQKYFSESMIKYFKKWHPVWQYKVLRFFWPLGKLLAILFFKIKKNNE